MNESLKPSQHMLDTLEQTASKQKESLTQPPGLTKRDGNPTTEAVLEALESAMMPDPSLKTLGQTVEGLVQSGSSKEIDSQQNTKHKHSPSDKAKLSRSLAMVCAMQNQYGKTDAELELIVEGFCLVLKEYPMETILVAIHKHTKNNNSIPTPADIENIINPPLPKIDWPFYITLQKKRIDSGYNYYLSPEEKAFIRNCEDLAMIRQRGEMESYADAQRQVERHKSTMITSDY
jgi:hypothetical protein